MATTEKRQPTEAQLRARAAGAERFRRLLEERQALAAATGAARDISDTEVMVATMSGQQTVTEEE